MYTVNDLLTLRLTPNEFMAATYILTQTQEGTARISPENVAKVLGCSYPTAVRVVSSLVEKGVFSRPKRGILEVHTVKDERSPVIVADEVTITSDRSRVSHVVDMVDMRHVSLVEPDGSTNSGGTPQSAVQKTMGKIMPISYDDGDDLGGFGLTEPRTQQKTRTQRKRELKFHRLVPREDWQMAHVVREFRMRLVHARPDILGGTDGHRMQAALSTWKSDHGLTPQDAATAVDMFFDTPALVADLKENPAAYKYFLRFLQTQYRAIQASEVTDDWLDSLDKQLEEL